MKKLLFAALLTAGGIAVAQTTTTTSTTTTDQSTTGVNVTASTNIDGSMVAPGNTNPEEDARGIRVISDPAVAPPGTNQVNPIPPGAQVIVNPNQGTAFSTRPATENYPACSATVTDNCVQSYEGRRRR